ncbi:OprD family porin [Endozoicomonas euniceicola]|uniref:OprD family porin n=1 Tax=Endozoicomonas euniceicola TaxID=1234143 RepID=A0ABY6GST1_9GAMM|nr:OprD family porin [Endozoicomonas euniceicola]UYM15809.1 OprD family porin [Endozoicomonas euniceicola]
MFKRTLIATAVIAAACASTTTSANTSTSAFFDDSTVSGGVYNMTRIRDRQPNGSEHFAENIHHSTTMVGLNFSSGLVGGVFGIDLGAHGTWDMWNSGSSQWSEFSLVDDKNKIKDGFTINRANVKLDFDVFKARAGYIQPSGPGVLGVNWSFMPGTYRGAEGVYSANGLTIAYMWADEYKNPWNYDMEKMTRNDAVTDKDDNVITKATEIDYVQSLGASYAFGNGYSVLGAWGEGEDFVDLYKFKLAKDGEGFNVSYHFYGMNDRDDKEDSLNNIYDGLTYQHVLMSKFNKDNWTFRAEATYTIAKGKQGNFVVRPTGYNGGFGKSNGAYEVWWDSRSDFNHNEEKAVFLGATYDFDHGWSAGASFAYGWDGKSNDTKVTTEKLKEIAYNLDVGYTFQSGQLKGASVKAHYTIYDLETDVNSWSTAFPNAFRDERDLKISFAMPFSF